MNSEGLERMGPIARILAVLILVPNHAGETHAQGQEVRVAAARALPEFVRSKEGRAVLEKYGFATPGPANKSSSPS